MMRNKTIDGMKAIAILAVVFYHLGVLKYGFLGVDVFFVIAGYFAAKSLMKESSRPLLFIMGRVKRIAPAVMIVGIVCLVIGYIGMLPDDFENLSEQIIASNIFSENILSNITTRNYWDIVNDYKPLMHMWYVGILFEFYLIIPFIFKGLEKIKNIGGGILCITVLSLTMYILPFSAESDKFYFIQYRFFELGVGVIICYFGLHRKNKAVFYSSFVLLMVMLWLNPINLPAQVRLIVVVLTSGNLLMYLPMDECVVGNRVLSGFGKRSYSIFVWHQVLLAFYRYFYGNNITLAFLTAYLIVVSIVSELSYQFIEGKLGAIRLKATLIYCAVLFVVSCGGSGVIFLHAGVVRDVPELDIYMNGAHRGMHAEYNDRIYGYDHDFMNDGTAKVLIVGDSFARDWGNILIESGLPLDISYAYVMSEDLIPRIKIADYIFYRILYENIPNYGFETEAEIYGIGTKSFGDCNGAIYKNRGLDNYFEQTVAVQKSVMEEYVEQKQKWGDDNYIDMIAPVETEPGIVRVFSDEDKFISQDCRHLTQGGAKYYTKLINLKKLFRIRQEIDLDKILEGR